MEILKSSQYKIDINSTLMSKAFAYMKDKQGYYLGCNQKVPDYAGLNSINDFIGLTDLELPWRRHYNKYIKNEHKVKQQLEPIYSIEPSLNAKNESLDLLSVKAPLQLLNDEIVGIIGISIPLDLPSFNDVMSQFLHAANTLHLKLQPQLMVRIITKAMQLNHCQRQWHHNRKLFDYGEVRFTLREAQCLHYLLRGYSAHKTASKLYISSKTVEQHIAK